MISGPTFHRIPPVQISGPPITACFVVVTPWHASTDELQCTHDPSTVDVQCSHHPVTGMITLQVRTTLSLSLSLSRYHEVRIVYEHEKIRQGVYRLLFSFGESVHVDLAHACSSWCYTPCRLRQRSHTPSGRLSSRPSSIGTIRTQTSLLTTPLKSDRSPLLLGLLKCSSMLPTRFPLSSPPSYIIVDFSFIFFGACGANAFPVLRPGP